MHLPAVAVLGVSLSLPAGWHAVVHQPGVPDAGSPRTLASAASGRIRVSSTGCRVTTYAFPPRGVAIVLVEWTDRHSPGATWPHRPAHFTAGNLAVRPGQLECWGGRGGGIQFADHGRRFGAYVLAHGGTPARLVVRARAVLDRLRVR